MFPPWPSNYREKFSTCSNFSLSFGCTKHTSHTQPHKHKRRKRVFEFRCLTSSWSLWKLFFSCRSTHLWHDIHDFSIHLRTFMHKFPRVFTWNSSKSSTSPLVQLLFPFSSFSDLFCASLFRADCDFYTKIFVFRSFLITNWLLSTLYTLFYTFMAILRAKIAKTEFKLATTMELTPPQKSNRNCLARSLFLLSFLGPLCGDFLKTKLESCGNGEELRFRENLTRIWKFEWKKNCWRWKFRGNWGLDRVVEYCWGFIAWHCWRFWGF
jgi:hypothetical protein